MNWDIYKDKELELLQFWHARLFSELNNANFPASKHLVYVTITISREELITKVHKQSKLSCSAERGAVWFIISLLASSGDWRIPRT